MSIQVSKSLERALKPVPGDKLTLFRNFLRVAWRHLGLPEPTPIQLDMADYLQFGPRRGILEAFRGVGKSWITSAFVVWLLYRDPQLNILVVSASKVRADEFSTFTQRLILEMPILATLKPREGQRFSKVSFDVGPALASHAPSVKSMGITGQLAGSRADVIVADDVEVPNNSMTQGLREKLSEAVKEFDAILKTGGRVVYLGTPQLDMSLYNRLPARGYDVRIWPARYPSQKRIDQEAGRIAPMIADLCEKYPEWMGVEDDKGNTLERGRPTDPDRFNENELVERELSYGRSGFALQFMLDTHLSDTDRFPLKMADLVFMEINSEMAPEVMIHTNDRRQRIEDLPNAGMDGDYMYRPMATPGKFVPYTSRVLVVDPSGRGGDETSFSVGYFLNGNIFIPAAGAVPGGYEEATMMALVNLAKNHKVNEILIESNFGDGMFGALLAPYLKKHYPCTITEVRHSQQKEQRIVDTLEPVCNQHRLIIDPTVVQTDYDSVQERPAEQQNDYMLFYQMTRMTKDRGALKHDDRVDALAMTVAYFVEQMSLDDEDEKRKHDEAAREREIDDTIRRAMSDDPNVFTYGGLIGSPIDTGRLASGGKGRWFGR